MVKRVCISFDLVLTDEEAKILGDHGYDLTLEEWLKGHYLKHTLDLVLDKMDPKPLRKPQITWTVPKQVYELNTRTLEDPHV